MDKTVEVKDLRSLESEEGKHLSERTANLRVHMRDQDPIFIKMITPRMMS